MNGLVSNRCGVVCCETPDTALEEFTDLSHKTCWPQNLDKDRLGTPDAPEIGLSFDADTWANFAQYLEPRPRQFIEAGTFYTGQWYEGRRHGHGIIERRGVGEYEGQFVGGVAFGNGRFIKVTGDVYEGQWSNDRAHGKGSYVYSNGSAYRGEWDQDLKSGKGIESWLDGSTFSGSYVEGRKHGHGVYKSADSATFEGQFRLDAMDGEGQYVFADGRIYVGGWKQSKMFGDGRMIWRDGQRYEGQYVDDKRSGDGKFVWPDGRCFYGQWSKGKQHGRGVYTDAQGRRTSGHWHYGTRVKFPNTLGQDEVEQEQACGEIPALSFSRASHDDGPPVADRELSYAGSPSKLSQEYSSLSARSFESSTGPSRPHSAGPPVGLPPLPMSLDTEALSAEI